MTKIRGGLTPRISWSFWNCYHGNKTRNEQREREVVGWMGRLTGMFQPKSALLGPDSIDVWMIHWTIQRTIHRIIQRKGYLVLEERVPFTSKIPSQTLFNSKGPFGFPIMGGGEKVGTGPFSRWAFRWMLQWIILTPIESGPRQLMKCFLMYSIFWTASTHNSRNKLAQYVQAAQAVERFATMQCSKWQETELLIGHPLNL